MIVVFALFAAAFAGEQGVRQERQAVYSYGAYPYGASVYNPVSAYSAYTGYPTAGYPAVTSYSAWPANGLYNGVYAGVPVARALW